MPNLIWELQVIANSRLKMRFKSNSSKNVCKGIFGEQINKMNLYCKFKISYIWVEGYLDHIYFIDFKSIIFIGFQLTKSGRSYLTISRIIFLILKNAQSMADHLLRKINLFPAYYLEILPTIPWIHAARMENPQLFIWSSFANIFPRLQS